MIRMNVVVCSELIIFPLYWNIYIVIHSFPRHMSCFWMIFLLHQEKLPLIVVTERVEDAPVE